MFNNIVCAVDGSEHAARAATLAAALAAKFDSKLTLLTVAKELKMTAEVKRYIELEHLSGEPQYVLDEYTESVIDRAKEAAEAEGLRGVRTEVRSGNPARSIVEFADIKKADCIVLGRRGMGDIEGVFLGSVSFKVNSLANCTVITVK